MVLVPRKAPIKAQKEVPANDLDRSIDDGSASGSGNRSSSAVAGSHTSTEARLGDLQVQRRGGRTKGTDESIGSQAQSIESDTASSSPSDYRRKVDCPIYYGRRARSRESVAGSSGLETSTCGTE